MKQNKYQDQVSKVRIKKRRDLFVTGLPEYAIEVLYKYSPWTLIATTYNLKLANKIKKIIEGEQC